MHYKVTRINVVSMLFTGMCLSNGGELDLLPFGFILKREKTGQRRNLTAGPFP